MLIISGISNARRSMKIDIVNPMSPRNPIPRMFTHFTLEGKEHIPILTPRIEKGNIPNGFPINKPAIMPKL